MPPIRRSRHRSRVLKTVRAGLGLAALILPVAHAQAPLLRLPNNYMSRFGSSEVAYTTATGYGVRYIPLPTDPDIRLSVVKQANYWEINAGSRVNDTTLAGGVYFNGYGAAAGIPRMEYTHNPDLGVQYSALVQGSGLHSHLSGGYAVRVLGNRVRVLGTAGIATQADVVAPYTQAEVAGSVDRTFGKVNASAGATVRTSLFPAQGQALGNVDLYVAASSSPLPGLSLAASHFERFVVGSVPLPDFGMGRYEESSAWALYRWPATGHLISLGGVRGRAGRNWISGYTTVWADVLLDVRGLPNLMGPGVGYQFGPDGKDSRWLVTLVTLGR